MGVPRLLLFLSLLFLVFKKFDGDTSLIALEGVPGEAQVILGRLVSVSSIERMLSSLLEFNSRTALTPIPKAQDKTRLRPGKMNLMAFQVIL